MWVCGPKLIAVSHNQPFKNKFSLSQNSFTYSFSVLNFMTGARDIMLDEMYIDYSRILLMGYFILV